MDVEKLERLCFSTSYRKIRFFACLDFHTFLLEKRLPINFSQYIYKIVIFNTELIFPFTISLIVIFNFAFLPLIEEIFFPKKF